MFCSSGIESIINSVLLRWLMSKKSIRKRGKVEIPNPLYLNANLIYSEALQRLKGGSSGTLRKLKSDGFSLVSSILCRMEIIQNLRIEKSLDIDKARHIYNSIIEDYAIAEILVHEHVELTPDYLDNIAKTRLSLKDAIHLDIARSLDIPVCSHETRWKDQACYENKQRYYEKIYKPSEIIKPKNKD